MSKHYHTYKGETKTLQDWGEELDIKWKTLWARLDKGQSVEEAFSKNRKRKIPERNPDHTIKKKCAFCKATFVIPKCRDWRESCCSSACKAARRQEKSEALAESRKSRCVLCGSEFVRKKSQIDSGYGSFCSQSCARRSYMSDEVVKAEIGQKRLTTYMNRLKAAEISHPVGENNPSWKGGKKAAYKRRIQSGKNALALRRYRKNNREKCREFARRRKSKLIKRLPHGTLPRLGKLQMWKCAICHTCIKGGYHVDHIEPLAKGGEHEPLNIQLLCAPCNLRKSAKDPVKHMQELGFLC